MNEPEQGGNRDPNLTKFLANAGVAARRKCADMIKAGLVKVNGSVECNPGVRISPSDKVEFEGRVIRSLTHHHYVMLNKPRGYVCTCEDEHAAKKAVDLISLPDHPRLVSAGRLDKNSEGLILFSNDGDFVARLTHPRHEVRKTYEVSAEYPLSAEDQKRMLAGIEDAGETLRALEIRTIGVCKYRLVLGEGKNREIRRMMSALGNETRRLRRVAVGRLELGSLPCGVWRELTAEEICQAVEGSLD